MAKVQISKEEFNKHQEYIVQRLQSQGFQQIGVIEESRLGIRYCKITGYKLDFGGSTEQKSTLFPLELEIEVIE